MEFSSFTGDRRQARAQRAFVSGLRAGLAGVLLMSLATASAQDAMPRPAGLAPGDPVRGRALVADRQQGLCLLCHTAPLPEARQQGSLAPSLEGTGSRWSEEQLRMRVFDSRRINPESLMPAYGVADTGSRVGATWRGKPIFSEQQIEDVVAWLVTLK